MTTIHTLDSDWSATIQLPDDGDAPTAQLFNIPYEAISNNTEWLRERTQSYARYAVSGTVGDAATLTLTEDFEAGGYVLASNTITFPDEGVYEIAATVQYSSSDTTNPKQMFLSVVEAASTVLLTATSWRPTASSGDAVSMTAAVLLEITDTLTQTLKLVNFSGTGNATAFGTLSIRRVS